MVILIQHQLIRMVQILMQEIPQVIMVHWTQPAALVANANHDLAGQNLNLAGPREIVSHRVILDRGAIPLVGPSEIPNR